MHSTFQWQSDMAGAGGMGAGDIGMLGITRRHPWPRNPFTEGLNGVNRETAKKSTGNREKRGGLP